MQTSRAKKRTTVRTAPPKGPVLPAHNELVTAHINGLVGSVPGRILTKTIPLWPGRFRVNVYTRESSGGLIDLIKILHSFFVVTDRSCTIIRCDADGDRPKTLWK